MQHRCTRCAAKPGGQQKSPQRSEWTLEGVSTAVGGHGEKLSIVSKEAETIDVKCKTWELTWLTLDFLLYVEVVGEMIMGKYKVLVPNKLHPKEAVSVYVRFTFTYFLSSPNLENSFFPRLSGSKEGKLSALCSYGHWKQWGQKNAQAEDISRIEQEKCGVKPQVNKRLTRETCCSWSFATE